MRQQRTRQITAREVMDWQTNLLRFYNTQQGIDYTNYFLADEAEKWGTAKELTGQSGILAHFCKLPLITGSPYFVTAEIQDIIFATAKLRNSMKYSLLEHQLITPSGFLVFEKQIYLKDIRGDHVGIRAMTWRTATVSLDPRAGGIVDLTHRNTGMGVEITFYTDTHVDDFWEQDTLYIRAAEEAGGRENVRTITRFVLLAHKGLPFGDVSFEKNPEQLDDLDAVMLPLDIEPSPELADKVYAGEITMTGDLINIMKKSDPDVFFPHDLFVSTVLVMNQKVAGIAGANADRAAYKRAQREGITAPNLVNIVTLRKLIDRGKIFPGEEEETDVNWSHRWWVRGHWRQQYYPSRNAHEWIYIESFVKGPDSLPLIMKPDVYFLER